MIILIILSILDVVAMFIVNPINVFTWFSVGTTISFILRPFGIHVKAEKFVPAEALMFFVTIMISMVIRTFSIKTYILMLLIRLVFYAIVYYDDTQYVYYTEEKEKEI